MMQPRLSVYIPTFNRQNTLCELLNHLARNRKTTENDIEIVVSDNASTDGTLNLCVQASNLGIIDRYVRNGKNLGADRNILNCFKHTAGDFVWILCDDDLPVEDAEATILEKILTFHDKPPSLIHLNASIETMDGHVTHHRTTNCNEGFECDLENLLVTPGIELLRASTLVLRRQVLPGIYVDSFGVGRLISPLALAFDAIVAGSTYLFSEPQVRYREGDKSGWIHEWPKVSEVWIPAAFRQICADQDVPSEEILSELRRRLNLPFNDGIQSSQNNSISSSEGS